MTYDYMGFVRTTGIQGCLYKMTQINDNALNCTL